jgi:hypothetical protein
MQNDSHSNTQTFLMIGTDVSSNLMEEVKFVTVLPYHTQFLIKSSYHNIVQYSIG